MATASRRRNRNQRKGNSFQPGWEEEGTQNIFQLLESNQFQSPFGGAASTDPDLTRCVLYKHVGGSKHSGNAFPKPLISHPGL